MQKWLKQEKGLYYNYKTVWRVMQKYGLLSECRRSRYYRPSEAFHVYPNDLNQNFHSEQSNTKWVTDITYIHTPQGTLYLSAILDLYDRHVVAYRMSTRNDCKLVLDTLKAAMKMKKVTVKRQLHSDQGFQYTSQAYFSLTKEYGISPSMSRRANPYDNAVVENFFGMLKTECIYPGMPQTIAQARQFVQLYMDFYNGERMILK
jgi:transposase InsO family protein